MSLKYRSVKGMADMFESELSLWRHVEQTARNICLTYGYGEIRTPALEPLELFKRGVGEGTDIVDKEMYVLKDKGDKDLCLRPENTASVVRAMLQAGKLNDSPEERVFYIGPMFRRERPQKGRLRQFHQLGIENFGLSSPKADVEIISLALNFLNKLELKSINLFINSLGRPEDRKEYSKILKTYLENHKSELCEDCVRRLDKNILRVLDCKNKTCQKILENSPNILEVLSQEAKAHYEAVKQGLTSLEIKFTEMPKLVRGLDYYTDTVFEFMAESGLGSQNTVAAGGRYDGLVKSFGGQDVPGVGFALGLERLILMIQENSENQNTAQNLSPEITLINADKDDLQCEEKCEELLYALRARNIYADFDLRGKNLKAQFKRANKLNSKFALVIGGDEIKTQSGKLRNLETGAEQQVALSVDELVQKL